MRMVIPVQAYEDERGRIEDLLNLWIFLDFFNQDKLPSKASGKPGDALWSEFASGEKRRKGSQWSEWHSWEGDQSRLADIFTAVEEKLKGGAIAQVDLLVGKISSNDLIRKVAKGQKAASDDEWEAREERGEDVAALQLSFSGEGSLISVELSPLLWVAGKANVSLAAPEELYKGYEESCKRIEDEDHGFDSTDCRLCDVAAIVQKEARPLVEQLYDGEKQQVSAKVSEVFETVLACYYFKSENGWRQNDKPLCRRYYIDDLRSMKKALGSNRAGELIQNGAFDVAIDYMMAALNEDRRPSVSLDLFPSACIDAEKEGIAGLNCLPFLGHREMGGFLMRTDLRVKHDLDTRRTAVELFDSGRGYGSTADALSVPRNTMRKWHLVYRAFGSEALLSMDGKQARYTYEQKVAAAAAVVDGGMAKPAAMAEFGIMSLAPLERWCRLYREGGAEALEPKPKGRPKGSRPKPRERTREQELEERCRRLETEVAYLRRYEQDIKKLEAPPACISAD